MATLRERRSRRRLDYGLVELDWVAPLPEPPVARISWVLPPSEFARIELERPKGQRYGPSAGLPGYTELFTAPDRSLQSIFLDLEGDPQLSPGPPGDGSLPGAIAASARPGRIVLHSFGAPCTAGVAQHGEHVTASFLPSGPWEGSLARFQIVAFARGVFVGIERERWVLAFVTVLRSASRR